MPIAATALVAAVAADDVVAVMPTVVVETVLPVVDDAAKMPSK